ncbi:MAG: zinc ribbon domain-containing protein [Methanobacteriota archaeon]|nr:MAG: zinc ribbon domain-containing protein [Euryarchaeota archaeon]
MNSKMESGETRTCEHCGVELNQDMVCPVCGESYKVVLQESAAIPSRKPFPSTELTHEGSCQVCGYVLTEESTSCPMCDSPLIQEEQESQEYRCPVCEEPMDMDAAECSRCGINLEGKDERVELQFRCPVCQENMKVDDQECSNCKARIWLDLGEEVRKLEEYRCPMCDESVEEESEKCPSCGADVWMRDEDILKKEATTKIEEAETQLEIEKEETDSDLANAVKFLTVAREAYQMNDFSRAARCASLSVDLARSAGLQKRILTDAMHRAERMVTLIDEKGGDVVQAKELLDASREEVGKGNYRKALKMAIRGKVLAQSTIQQEAVLMIDAETLD